MGRQRKVESDMSVSDQRKDRTIGVSSLCLVLTWKFPPERRLSCFKSYSNGFSACVFDLNNFWFCASLSHIFSLLAGIPQISTEGTSN